MKFEKKGMKTLSLSLNFFLRMHNISSFIIYLLLFIRERCLATENKHIVEQKLIIRQKIT
jgi:hypothetical protein